MIVKNEKHVIQRCIASVRSIISYWTIVDTGSSDGTQQFVQELLKDIPGQLLERKWVNFSTNRNEAIQFARPHTDYLLIVDADDIITTDGSFASSNLRHDAYLLTVKDHGCEYDRIHLISSARDWRYEGVVHECIKCGAEPTLAKLECVTYVRVGGGSRSHDINKFLNDANDLEEALKTEPDNKRYTFYLAQSYRDARMYERAIAIYEKRVAMGGWREEVWYSKYQIAVLLERSGAGLGQSIQAYVEAYSYRPERAETLTRLSVCLRRQELWAAAYLFSKAASEMVRPNDRLFVEPAVYSWSSLDEYSISAFYVEKYAESKVACERLLSEGFLAECEIERVQRNFEFARRYLSQNSRIDD